MSAVDRLKVNSDLRVRAVCAMSRGYRRPGHAARRDDTHKPSGTASEQKNSRAASAPDESPRQRRAAELPCGQRTAVVD